MVVASSSISTNNDDDSTLALHNSQSTMSETPKLFSMLEKRKWRRVRKALKSSEAPELCQETDATGLSCLGIALGFQAPVDIIKQMIAVSPSLIDQTDSFGAGCLHIACLNGSSLEAIEYLIENFPHLISSTDNDKRIPLHHAVEFACQCTEEEDEDFYLDLIETLYNANPESIHHSDKANDSPLDLIQMFRTTFGSAEQERLDEIYRLVRRLSIEQYRKKKKKWEDDGYDLEYIERVKEKGEKDDATRSTAESANSGTSKVSTVIAEPRHEGSECDVESMKT